MAYNVDCKKIPIVPCLPCLFSSCFLPRCRWGSPWTVVTEPLCALEGFLVSRQPCCSRLSQAMPQRGMPGQTLPARSLRCMFAILQTVRKTRPGPCVSAGQASLRLSHPWAYKALPRSHRGNADKTLSAPRAWLSVQPSRQRRRPVRFDGPARHPP